MAGNLRRLLGMVRVTERNSVIRVDGINVQAFRNDVMKVWGTSRVFGNMILSMGRSSLTFDSFYAVEMEYIFKTLKIKGGMHTTRAVMDKVDILLNESTWLANRGNGKSVLDFSQLRKINGKLLDSQMDFLKTYDANVGSYNLTGYILGSPPGSGKTLTGLALALCLKAEAMIVVCPKNAIYRVWEADILRWIKGDAKIWYSDKKQPIEKGYDYYICHYEYLDTLYQSSDVFDGVRTFIDLDECHNFNDPDSRRSELYYQLCKKVSLVGNLWASGTPIKAMAKEMIGFLKSSDPLFTDQVETSFKRIFGLSTTRAADILSHRMGIVQFTVDKSTVVDGEPIEETIKVKIPNGQRYTLESIKKEMSEFIESRLEHYNTERAEHRAIFNQGIRRYELLNPQKKDSPAHLEYLRSVKQIINTTHYRMVSDEIKSVNQYEKNEILPSLHPELRNKFKKSKGVVKYPELVVRGEALGGVLGKRRMECHVDMVKYTPFSDLIDNSIKKTLVFSSHVEVVRAVDRELRTQKYKPLCVFAETNKDLPRIINSFTKEAALNPLIATYQSLSTAVPVIAANTVLFLNDPFRDYEREQALSRVHRLGQDTQVYLYNTYLDTDEEPNISTRSKDIMSWYKQQVDLLMGKENELALESLSDYLEGNLETTTHKLPASSAW